MEQNIVIIGAGIAGLIAALHLEKEGFAPVVIESTDRIGGRVKTENINGFLLDRGFQILLTDYPEANKYLDFNSLQLASFNPGAIVYHKGKRILVTDPLRKPLHIFQALLAPIGTIKDKWLVFKLQRQLSKTKPENFFLKNDISTLSFLKKFGFSDKIIERFFKPFFTGIFLNDNLQVPAAMFKYVFQLLASGSAALPAHGIEAIAQQLGKKLKTTSFIFNDSVSSINSNNIELESGKTISASAIVVATDPAPLMSVLKNQKINFNKTINHYFSTAKPVLNSPTLALVADNQSIINSFCEPTSIQSNYSKSDKTLISVSLKPNLTETPTVDEIKEELSRLTHYSTNTFEWIHSFTIENALPQIDHLKYTLDPTEVKLNEGVFLAGDYLLYPSLDAAMKSGRIASEAVVKYLQG